MEDANEILRLIRLFDEWLSAASPEIISQNCREQGNMFFLFLEQRNIERSWTASLIKKATGYNAAHLWKVMDVDAVKEALNSYYMSMQAVNLEEVENGGEQLSVDATQDVVLRFWN